MLDEIGQSIDAVLVVRAPADEILRRLNGRITCRACNEVMNLVGFGSSRPKFCPFCGSEKDPKRGKKTLPAAWLLEERFPLFEIDGLGTPSEVAGRIAEVLK